MVVVSQQKMDELINRYHRPETPLYHTGVREMKPVKKKNPRWLALPEKNREIVAASLQIDEYITEQVPVQSWQNANVLIEAYQTEDGGWEVLKEQPDATPTTAGTSATGPNQRAEKEEESEQNRRERSWNLNNGPQTLDPNTGQPGRGSGRNETHAERAARERLEGADARAEETAARSARTEERSIAATERQIAQQESSNELARAKFNADEAFRYRPDAISTPTDTAANIAIWDPTSQEVRSVPNPIYDAAKVEAARLKDQLSTGIALNQITAQQAAQQYKQWWDTNVELPFKQAQEQRARAAEQRAALEAEDRRKQFASDFSLRSSTLGFQAGDAAVKNEISLLPYRAGPEAGEQFSAAINSLGQGGKVYGPDASAGINFTADAFEFDRPDFEGIAKKATKNALKGLTKYSPEGSFSQADYSGVPTPSGEGAPSSTGGGIDLSQLWQQYLQSGVQPYTGPEE